VTIEILPRAREDIVAGHRFYEQQHQGAGSYFRDSIFAAVEKLHVTAGVHRMHHGYHRARAHPFPFAIYYRVANDVVHVHAILDCRRDPQQLARTLRTR
jgi:plasmid stabilization system protein ParE